MILVEYVIIKLDKDMEWDEESTVKVVQGDLEIDEDHIKVDDTVLIVTVTEEIDKV